MPTLPTPEELEEVHETARVILLLSLTSTVVFWAWRAYVHFTYWLDYEVPYLGYKRTYGDLWQLATRKKTLFQSFQEIYQAYPEARYVGYYSIMHPILLIRDPELIREIGIREFDCFSMPFQSFDANFDPILSKNVASLHGPEWRKLRNALTPSFTAAKMRVMFGLIDECAVDFIRHFEGNPGKCAELDAKEVFSKFTCDAIATCAFGIKIDSLRDPNNEFFKAGEKFSKFDIKTVLKLTLIQGFPWTKYLMSSILEKKIAKFFTDVITETVETRRAKRIYRPDMIQVMMEAQDKRSLDEVVALMPGSASRAICKLDGPVPLFEPPPGDRTNPITIDEMVAQALVFFLAGFGATAYLMSALAYVLGGEPEIQEKLRAEIDGYFENRDDQDQVELTYDSLYEFKYLDMVVNETLRKYPPTSVSGRTCTYEYPLPAAMDGFSEYEVQLGIQCVIPIHAIHHDPKYYPDPDRFDPERFSPERKSRMNPFCYLPFGLGPRRCVGDRFVLMETKILFIRLLRTFAIKLSDKVKYPMEFDKSSMSQEPESGFIVSFERRKKAE